MLRLGDLLAATELGLTLRTGPADAAERLVQGAAVVEVPNPSRWIAASWVLMTAGVRLEGRGDDELRALVAECDHAQTAAIAFGIGPVFDELPAPLLEEGEARRYPILAVPTKTPFMDVVRFVDTAIMGSDEALFRRLSSLQRFVVDALRDPDPESAVVERLARFMDASAAVLDPVGAPELTRGRAPFDALWKAVEGRGPAVHEAEADGWHAVVAPLAAPAGAAPRWLVLASPRAGFIGTLAKRAAETTAPLLVAMYGEIRNRMRDAGIDPVGVDLKVPDLPLLGRAFGGEGVRAVGREELEAALRAALDRPRPTIIEVPA